MHNSFVGEASVCPIIATWEARREQFRRFEFGAFGEHGTSLHPQIEPLIYELEHTYCAGAWIAALVLAHAMVEVFMHSKGQGNKKDWGKYLASHGLDGKVEWLCNRRNALLHMKNLQTPSIELDKLLFDRDSLYADAKKSVAIAFRLVFLETRRQ
jgi:hypothetical protein